MILWCAHSVMKNLELLSFYSLWSTSTTTFQSGFVAKNVIKFILTLTEKHSWCGFTLFVTMKHRDNKFRCRKYYPFQWYPILRNIKISQFIFRELISPQLISSFSKCQYLDKTQQIFVHKHPIFRQQPFFFLLVSSRLPVNSLLYRKNSFIGRFKIP